MPGQHLTEYLQNFALRCNAFFYHCLCWVHLYPKSYTGRYAFNFDEELKGNLIKSSSVLWLEYCHSSLAGSPSHVPPRYQTGRGWQNVHNWLGRPWWRAVSWWFSEEMPGVCLKTSKTFTPCPEKPQKTVYRKQRLYRKERQNQKSVTLE